MMPNMEAMTLRPAVIAGRNDGIAHVRGATLAPRSFESGVVLHVLLKSLGCGYAALGPCSAPPVSPAW